MTAEVELLIEELHDVLYVPLQAVSSPGRDRVCYLANGERSVVETGPFNDKYIEITSGLEEGDEILLRAVEGDREREEEERTEDTDKGEEPETEPVGAEPAPA